MFRRCKQERRIAIIPFVMLGDPTVEASLNIINCLVDSGADGLELGFPIFNPTADGPVIRASAKRALQKGVNANIAFEMLNSIREIHKEIPIGLLVYEKIIKNYGIDDFFFQCSKSSVDSVLIPDVSVLKTESYDQCAKRHNVDSIHILSPSISDDEFNLVAANSEGYVYVKSREGVTGTHAEVKISASGTLDKLRAANSAPAVLGYGVFKREHIVQARKFGFAGVICGSAIITIIEKYEKCSDELLGQLRIFVSKLKQASVD